ncbi:MAG TPA: endonuclease/exonuclease/phosphatase family protein [Candidatus Limnocylindria bacterium]|nr:endonuclease/exonuclease/phosphatase family protein [Candidatus Limnocylindria bacterium]
MRVLQLNIWARYGPYAEREPRLRQLFADLEPDLIAMQEVAAIDGGANQADELLGNLGYRVAYTPHPGNKHPGIAVASRLGMTESRVKELGHDGVAIAGRIPAGDEGFWFCSAVPLSWLPGFESQREDECLVLDEWLSDLAADDTIPPILAGDFDATPDASSIRFLTGLQSLRDRSTYWADAFALAGDGSPGFTWTTESPYVRPFAEAVFGEPNHHRRIDYVFVGSPIRWRPRLVIRSAMVVGRYENGAGPSDHYGVLADIQLDGDAFGGGRGLDAWDDSKRALGWG